MIRFIVQRKQLDRYSNLESSEYETVDCDAPELESLLRRGGTGMDQYDYSRLIGCELLAEKETPHG